MEPQIRLRLNVLFKETKTNLVFNEKPEAKQVLRTKMKEILLNVKQVWEQKQTFLKSTQCATVQRKNANKGEFL